MSTPASGPANSGPGLLVVRLGSMGDVIHAFPAVASLKQSFPALPLTWAIEPRWACLLEGNPFVDGAVLIDRRSWSGLRDSLRRLRQRRYSAAIDFQGLIKSALVATFARPARIYGFHQSQLREPLAGLFYSAKARAASAHVVDRNLELAAAAGATSVLRCFPLPEGSPEGVLPASPFVLASPLAGWPAKQWPLEYYAELAELLKKLLGLPLVLNGPPSAAPVLSQVAGAEVHLSSIPGLIDATRRALAVVGIDSGPLHLAAALSKPGVAIYGPTDPARNGPYGGSIAVLRSLRAATSYKRKNQIDESMREVRPEAVFAALREQLEGSGIPSSL